MGKKHILKRMTGKKTERTLGRRKSVKLRANAVEGRSTEEQKAAAQTPGERERRAEYNKKGKRIKYIYVLPAPSATHESLMGDVNRVPSAIDRRLNRQ